VSKLQLPEGLPIVRLWAEDYTDWEGEDALMVHAILPEGLEVERVTGRDVNDAKSAIRDSLRAAGVTVFAYITMYKQSEVDEIEEDDEPIWESLLAQSEWLIGIGEDSGRSRQQSQRD
jgi:hypothetical protein